LYLELSMRLPLSKIIGSSVFALLAIGASAATAEPTTYSLRTPGGPVLVTKPVSLETCQDFNYARYGIRGVLRSLHTNLLSSCYGPDLANLAIVKTQSGKDLQYAATDPTAAVKLGSLSSSLKLLPLSNASIDGWLPGASQVSAAQAIRYSIDGTAADRVAFSDTEIGASAPERRLTVRNVAQVPVGFSAGSFGVSAPYSVSTNTCEERLLGANETCMVVIAFKPTAVAVYAGPQYTLKLNLLGGLAQGLPLSGVSVPVGRGLHIESAPATLSEVGDYHHIFAVVKPVLKNTSSQPIDLMAIAAVGDGFEASAGDCDAQLAPGATCTFQVEWDSYVSGPSASVSVAASIGRFQFTFKLPDTPPVAGLARK
jgi:hypothetical protein